jgi:GNAT superfamily N-acetyltransferase
MNKNRINYIVSKFRYDTLMQVFLDALKMIKIRINPYLIFHEGLKLTPVGFEIKKPAGIEFGFLQKEHMPMLLNFPDRYESLATLYRRLDHGDVCVAAWSDGKIIAFSWADFSELSFVPYHMRLLDSEAYLYDAYTSTEFRGKRIADALRYYLYEVLAERGKLTLYSVSQRYNPPAIRFKTKLGAKVVDSGISVRFFSRWEIKTSSNAEKIRKLAQ